MSILDERLELRFKPWKLLLIMGACLLMLAGSAVLAFGFGGSSPGDFTRFIGWVGLVLFGALTVLWLRQLSRLGQPAVILSREGLLDTRLSRQPVPWQDIDNMYLWEKHGQKVLVLQVSPETEDDIDLSRIARLTRDMNAGLGADGLCVPLNGLSISPDELMAGIDARFRAAQNNGRR